MKKNFTTPDINISAFSMENIIMASGVDTITAVDSVRNNSEFGAEEANTKVVSWTEIKTIL